LVTQDWQYPGVPTSFTVASFMQPDMAHKDTTQCPPKQAAPHVMQRGTMMGLGSVMTVMDVRQSKQTAFGGL
jgi:hypothetical protein